MTMPNIEDFLLAEFAEQHSGRRHLETVSLQIVQLFFTFQGIVVTGLLGLLALSISLGDLVGLLSLAFLFLFVLGHFARGIALETMMVGFELDLPITLVRHYFSRNDEYGPYIAFARDINDLEAEKPGQWEHLGEVNLIPRLSALISGFNLVAATALIGLAILTTGFPSALSSVRGLPIWTAIPLLLLFFVVFQIYMWLAFTKPLRVRELKFLAWQTSCIRRLKTLDDSSIETSPVEKPATDRQASTRATAPDVVLHKSPP